MIELEREYQDVRQRLDALTREWGELTLRRNQLAHHLAPAWRERVGANLRPDMKVMSPQGDVWSISEIIYASDAPKPIRVVCDTNYFWHRWLPIEDAKEWREDYLRSELERKPRIMVGGR